MCSSCWHRIKVSAFSAARSAPRHCFRRTSSLKKAKSRASPGRTSAARCGRNSGRRTRRCRSCIKSRELYKRLRGCEENALRSRAAFGLGSFSQRLSSCCPRLFPIALFSENIRYISIKSPFLTRILTHSLYYGNGMQRVCPTSAALFRCGCGDSKNKQSLRQKRRRRTTTKIKEERT